MCYSESFVPGVETGRQKERENTKEDVYAGADVATLWNIAPDANHGASSLKGSARNYYRMRPHLRLLPTKPKGGRRVMQVLTPGGG